MTRRLVASSALVLIAGLFWGCELLTGPDGKRVIGIIGWDYGDEGGMAGLVEDLDCLAPSDAPMHCIFLFPDTVDAGEPFEVVVRTVGEGGCWRPEGAGVSASPSFIEIVPYDRHFPDRGCLDADFWLARTLELVFSEPGEAILRVRGRVVMIETEEEGLVGATSYRMSFLDYPVVVR